MTKNIAWVLLNYSVFQKSFTLNKSQYWEFLFSNTYPEIVVLFSFPKEELI